MTLVINYFSMCWVRKQTYHFLLDSAHFNTDGCFSSSMNLRPVSTLTHFWLHHHDMLQMQAESWWLTITKKKMVDFTHETWHSHAHSVRCRQARQWRPCKGNFLRSGEQGTGSHDWFSSMIYHDLPFWNMVMFQFAMLNYQRVSVTSHS